MTFLARVAAATMLILLTAGGAGAETKIVMNYTTGESVTAFVGKETGIFAKHGLDVDLVPVVQNSNAPAALVANAVQIGMTQVALLLQAADSGIDLVAIANGSEIVKGESKYAVVARTGLDIKTAKDLVGKKIGVPGIGASIDIFFRAWLLVHDVQPSDLAIVETTFPAMADNLHSGNLDAVTPLEPFITRITAAKIGYEVANLVDVVPQPRLNALLFVTTRDWADKNRDIVKAVQEAIVEADAFIPANPEKTRASINKYTKMPMEILNSLPLPIVDPVLDKASFAWWADTMQRLHMLQARPDIGKLLYPG